MVLWPMISPPIRVPIRILGIDPGLRRTGWGVVDVDGNRLIHVGCGSVDVRETLPLAERLLAILARVGTVALRTDESGLVLVSPGSEPGTVAVWSEL